MQNDISNIKKSAIEHFFGSSEELGDLNPTISQAYSLHVWSAVALLPHSQKREYFF